MVVTCDDTMHHAVSFVHLCILWSCVDYVINRQEMVSFKLGAIIVSFKFFLVVMDLVFTLSLSLCIRGLRRCL